MKPHEMVMRLTELKQRGISRDRDAGPWASRYADTLFTYAAALAPAARLTAVEKLARVLDLLVTELATYRDRASTAPSAPLRTPDDILPGMTGDVEVTVSRGDAPPAVRTAVDRLAIALDSDYVIVISGDHLQLTARPARSPAANGYIPGFGQTLETGRAS